MHHCDIILIMSFSFILFISNPTQPTPVTNCSLVVAIHVLLGQWVAQEIEDYCFCKSDLHPWVV